MTTLAGSPGVQHEVSDLITELASVEVTYRTLGEIAHYSDTRVNATELDGTNFVGVDNLLSNKRGKANASYLPNTARLTRYEAGDILLGNIRPYLKKIWLATSGGGCSGDVLAIRISPIHQDAIDAQFLYFVLSSDAFFTYSMKHAKGAKMPRGNKEAILRYRIPLPPLDVQRKIVRILDSFAQLEVELESELEAELKVRRHQHKHYRTKLLEAARAGAPLIELGHLGRVVTGRTPKSSEASAWGASMDFITPSDIKNGMKIISSPLRSLSESGAESMSKAVVPAMSILVTCIGADMGKTVINANECVTNQQINAVIPAASVDIDYIFHLLTSMRGDIRAQGERGGGTMPIINKSDFCKILIPVPSLEVQRHIAKQLDNLDVLINDLCSNLSAELAARGKQYEYYRDRLVTFTEAVA